MAKRSEHRKRVASITIWPRSRGGFDVFVVESDYGLAEARGLNRDALLEVVSEVTAGRQPRALTGEPTEGGP